jgi:hypothetical protein
MENVARLVMIAHAIDWKAQTDDESDRAWGEAIRAAQQARGDATDHEVDDEERRA